LLPFDKSDQLTAFTARIHEALAKPLAYNDRLISIQASIGSAELPSDGIDFNQLLEVADQRMYENKRRRKMSQAPE
ncbi:MAG TPA: diguanylate cyclase, partial [Pseudidiomarina sp.]|nr:diguanylate cyclase [Pseudidiomarina sp.]